MRILILRPGSLGDVILSLPALRALRRRYPDARIEVMGNPSYLEILKAVGCADQISSFEQGEMVFLFLKKAALPPSIVDCLSGFDLVVSWVHDSNGVLEENLKRTGVGRILCANPFPPEGEKIHITEYLLGTLRPLGIEEEDVFPRVFTLEQEQGFASRFLEERGIKDDSRPIIAIHPGSGGRKKRWPLERFVKVAREAIARWEARVLLILGPAEGDIVKDVIKKENRVILVKGVTVSQLAGILGRCCCYLGNDSGVSHLSAALGKPTIAIFGPTDPSIWGVRGERAVILRKGISCSPCSRTEMLSCQRQRCLERVGVEEVLEWIERVRDKRAARYPLQSSLHNAL